MGCYEQCMGNQLIILSTLLSLVISDNLSSDQLNTLGNFIVAVGSLMLTKAAEIQALESQQDNSMAQMQQQIDQLQATLTKQMNILG